MSEFTGPAADQIPVTLSYVNDEGEKVRYEVTMAYGNVGGLLMAMDVMDGEDRKAEVGVTIAEDEDADE